MKRKLTKLTALLLSVIMLMALLPATAFAAQKSEVTTLSELINALSKAESGDGVAIHKDASFELDEKATIPAGVVLTNYGTIDMGRASISNYGTISNHGEIGCPVFNYASIINYSDLSSGIYNYGTVNNHGYIYKIHNRDGIINTYTDSQIKSIIQYYRAVFNANGGAFSGGRTTRTSDWTKEGEALLAPADPTLKGSRFLGWRTEGGVQWNFKTDTIVKNIKLYANWAEHEHIWGSWKVTTPATCKNKGVETRVCGKDASHTEKRSIAALGHNWAGVYTNPTNAAAGFWTYTCTRCSEQYTASDNASGTSTAASQTKVSASVAKLKGNQNELTITITEYPNGRASDPKSYKLMVDNNASGIYEVGGYKVYVDVKGNTDVRECYIVK